MTQAICEHIRKHVSRPKTLPIVDIGVDGGKLRWGNHGWKCPLGLLPQAVTECPCDADDAGLLGLFDDKDVEDFWVWWDKQKNPQAAVDAVWGKEEPPVLEQSDEQE